MSVVPGPLLSRLSAWVDPQHRVREEALFLPVHGEELFCVFHRPAGVPRGTVVLCCSLYAELLKLYRTEVLAARTLAAAGYLVGRFHYRGTGHSGGEGPSTTLATMVEDVRTVTAFLHREETPLLFLGCRWGGLVAGLAAAEWKGAALALWEPVIDARRFFQDMLFVRQFSALAAGGHAPTSRSLAELWQEGRIDALGYAIDRPLYDSAAEVSLMAVPAAGPRPVLLVQVGRGEELRAEAAALRDAFTAAGSAVSTSVIPREEAWSFIGAPLRSGDALIAATRAFLATHREA